MKKSLLVTGLLVLSLGASVAFAANSNSNSDQHSTMPMGQMNGDQMKDYHKQMVDQAIKDGCMTAEQAKAMDERMNSMQDMMKNMGTGMMGQGMMGANGCAGNQTQTGVSQQ